MAQVKISELTSLTTISDDDSLPIVDTSASETKKATASTIKSYCQDGALFGNSAYQHNNIYRGKNITSEWDAGTVSTNVANGTFEDIYIGDYITKTVTIDDTSYTCNFIIADLDTYYGGYSSYAILNEHHLGVIVSGLPNAQMNTSNTTSGGYVGSAMHTTTLPTYLSAIQTALGSSHLLSHQKIYSTSINSTGYNRYGTNSGCSNAWSWSTNQSISLLTESQVYGHIVWSSSGYDTGEAYKQLALFKMKKPQDVFRWKWWWLRDVVNSSLFARVSSSGDASYNGASVSSGVVPLILLK